MKQYHGWIASIAYLVVFPTQRAEYFRKVPRAKAGYGIPWSLRRIIWTSTEHNFLRRWQKRWNGQSRTCSPSYQTTVFSFFLFGVFEGTLKCGHSSEMRWDGRGGEGAGGTEGEAQGEMMPGAAHIGGPEVNCYLVEAIIQSNLDFTASTSGMKPRSTKCQICNVILYQCLSHTSL